MSNALVDNDIIFKTAQYNLALDLLNSNPYGADTFYMLSAAKFMLRKKLEKYPPLRGKEIALEELESILSSINMLEPLGEEVKLAAEFEYIASQAGKELDAGESLLCAILQLRQLDYIFTGDKRAIYAFEVLIQEKGLDIAHKVTCFEQLISYLLSCMPFVEVRDRVCKESATDRAMANCFGCRSSDTDIHNCQEGLSSYVKAIREQAPSVLIEDITQSVGFA